MNAPACSPANRPRPDLLTLAGALRAAAAQLEPVMGSGRLDATLLLEHVTGADRIAFVRDGDRALSEEQQAAFDRLVARRLSGVPIAYLTGNVGFYGRTFAVDERVLVPRPETELVVEAVLADLRGRNAAAGKVADVGTGSGAIAITLAAELPDLWVFGTDISADALAVARHNAARNAVAQQCSFVHGDLLLPLQRFAPFDCIVANLPYIPSAAVPRRPDPAGFEPVQALDGGPDGLDLYRRLIAQLPLVGTERTTVFCEAAPGTIAPLAALAAAAFPNAPVEICTDYAGLERFVRFSVLPRLGSG